MKGDVIPPTNYPLAWPIGVPRRNRHQRTRAKFGRGGNGTTMSAALHRLSGELRRFGARGVCISTNVPTRLDGLPYANTREPDDPGVAVYFVRDNKSYCFPCDRWDRVADNLTAVALHLDAMRGMDRWGVGTSDQAFAGYAALPPPASDWRSVFGIHRSTVASPEEKRKVLEEVEQLYRERAKTMHPDQGGTHSEMAKLNSARAAARRELGGTPP